MDNINIRNAVIDDLTALADIESKCFPAAEAAKEVDIRNRLDVYPDHFWILETDGEIAAFIDGMTTDEADLRDEMFEDASLHDPDGKWQMIFGLNTLPEHRDKGYAGMLIRRLIQDAQKNGRAGVVLTCKDHLVGYYGSFGFVSEGISGSEHGGVKWYQMRLKF